MSTELTILDDVENALLHGEVFDVATPEDVSGAVIQRILNAETIEEAAQDFTATPASEIAGEVVTVEDVAWLKSDYTEGAPVYALMRVTREDDPRPLTVSMGGRSVLATLLWAQRHNAMPIVGIFRQKQSKSNAERQFWTFQLPTSTANRRK